MPTAHLTDIVVQRLKSSGARVTYWDKSLPAFGVVRASQYGEQMVCFLTETKSPFQAEMFAALLATKNCYW